jgi:hypothetical protein
MRDRGGSRAQGSSRWSGRLVRSKLGGVRAGTIAGGMNTRVSWSTSMFTEEAARQLGSPRESSPPLCRREGGFPEGSMGRGGRLCVSGGREEGRRSFATIGDARGMVGDRELRGGCGEKQGGADAAGNFATDGSG